jgi:hypothetical protein
MENVIDLIATDSSPSEISDAIKSVIYSKAMDRLDAIKPQIASSLFDLDDENDNGESSDDSEDLE